MRVFLTIWLFYLMLFDLRTKQIPAKEVWLGIAVILLMKIVTGGCELKIMLFSLLPSMVLFAAAIVLRVIGAGDAVCFLGVGIALGMRETFEVLWWAIVLHCVTVLMGVVLKGNELAEKEPFLPAVFAAVVLKELIIGI